MFNDVFDVFSYVQGGSSVGLAAVQHAEDLFDVSIYITTYSENGLGVLYTVIG